MQIQVEAALQGIPGRLEALGIPGVAVAVVQDSRSLHFADFGVSDPDLGIPVDAVRDLFRVGSLSKPVTATLVLRLAARGRSGSAPGSEITAWRICRCSRNSPRR